MSFLSDIIRNDPQTLGIPYRLIRLTSGGVRVVLLPDKPDQHKKMIPGLFPPISGPFPPISNPEQYCWVGAHYRNKTKRLLILSESYYDKDHNLPTENPSAKLVEWCALKKANKVHYYRKIEHVCTGNKSDPAHSDTQAFWHGIALLHFVSKSLPAPRTAPTQDQMRADILRCIRLIGALEPTGIVIPSKRLWGFLLIEGLITESEKFIGHFHHFKGMIPAVAIGHPASATKYSDSREQIGKLSIMRPTGP